MSYLELSKVTKTYPGSSKPCIESLDISLEKGEIMVILGSSGCGKTTMLKMIAGLEQQDCGDVLIDGESMNGVQANKRPIAMVFQKPLLFKNMTVAENINYAPRVLKTIKKEELDEMTSSMLDLVELSGFEKRKVTQLSGGQEQRVSLARALITKPKILLLDEPFSALDAELRVSMRKSLREICKKLCQTVVFVTHDQQEAVAVADKIAVMMDGKIMQVGVPMDFYTKPINTRVASFFGWRNFFNARQEGKVVECPIGKFAIPSADDFHRDAILIMRPEAAICYDDGEFFGKVISATYLGVRSEYIIETYGVNMLISVNSRNMFIEGDDIRYNIDPNMLWVVEPEKDMQTSVEETAVKKHRFLDRFKK